MNEVYPADTQTGTSGRKHGDIYIKWKFQARFVAFQIHCA